MGEPARAGGLSVSDQPFVVVIRRRDGTTQTVFSHPDLYEVASQAFQVANRLSVIPDEPSQSPPRAVTIERGDHLELSIAITPGRPL